VTDRTSTREDCPDEGDDTEPGARSPARARARGRRRRPGRLRSRGCPGVGHLASAGRVRRPSAQPGSRPGLAERFGGRPDDRDRAGRVQDALQPDRAQQRAAERAPLRCPSTSRSAPFAAPSSASAGRPATAWTSTDTDGAASGRAAVTSSSTRCASVRASATRSSGGAGHRPVYAAAVPRQPPQYSDSWTTATTRCRAPRRTASSKANSSAALEPADPSIPHHYGAGLVHPVL
jgi:hypothetical protein